MDSAAARDAQCLAVQKATASFSSDGGSCADLEGLRGQDLHEFWRRSGIFGRSWFSRENQNLNRNFCKQSPPRQHSALRGEECEGAGISTNLRTTTTATVTFFRLPFFSICNADSAHVISILPADNKSPGVHPSRALRRATPVSVLLRIIFTSWLGVVWRGRNRAER